MVYELGEYCKTLGNYFFNCDIFGNVYVYQKGSMNYIDSVFAGSLNDYDTFTNICNNWIFRNS